MEKTDYVVIGSGIAGLRAAMTPLRNMSDQEIEKLCSSFEHDAEVFLVYVKACLDAEYIDCPKTRIVLCRAAESKMRYVKTKLQRVKVGTKISVKTLLDNVDYLENYYDENFPSGGRKVFSTLSFVA